MNDNGTIIKRQSTRTRFKNTDMDFALNWVLGVGEVLGMSPGEVLAVAATIKDGDPHSWREAFSSQAEYLTARASTFQDAGNEPAASHSAFGAAFARRAALHFVDPNSVFWDRAVSAMTEAFMHGIRMGGIPLDPIQVPFENGQLPGYFLKIDDQRRPTLLMVGGGDTFREDLFYFGGLPGWLRGYNVLMVDLPGQETTPSAGLTFRHNASDSIGACLDWLDSHLTSANAQIAVYGLSGGGFFTAQAVASDPRIGAWVASTPITDVALMFERELGVAMRAPGWLLKVGAKIGGRVNRIMDVSLKKYAWQFGTSDFAEAFNRVRDEATPIPASDLQCPSLFLLGDGEATELKRQTEALYADLKGARRDVTLHRFQREDGDAHCQVTNLALAHLIVFDWLDRQFKRETVENPRLRHLSGRQLR